MDPWPMQSGVINQLHPYHATAAISTTHSLFIHCSFTPIAALMDFPRDDSWRLCQGIRSGGHNMAASASRVERICSQLALAVAELELERGDRDPVHEVFYASGLPDMRSVLELLDSSITRLAELKLHSCSIAEATSEGVVSRASGSDHDHEEVVEGEPGKYFPSSRSACVPGEFAWRVCMYMSRELLLYSGEHQY